MKKREATHLACEGIRKSGRPPRPRAQECTREKMLEIAASLSPEGDDGENLLQVIKRFKWLGFFDEEGARWDSSSEVLHVQEKQPLVWKRRSG